MKIAPATFQRMNFSLQNVEGCEAYIDDDIIYSNISDEHLRITRALYDDLVQVYLEKSEFCRAYVEYLGHK